MATKIFFYVSGGIGKSVAATAVCKAIRKQYPKAELIVLSHYMDPFVNNPNVTRCYQPNNLQYFHTDHVAGHDIIPMLHDPYGDPAFIKRDGHLIKVWCEMNGVAYNGELPELFLTQKEKNEVRSIVKNNNRPILTSVRWYRAD